MAGSGRVIPREELSEFQRWQFSTLLEEVAYQQAVAHVEQDAQPEILVAPPQTVVDPVSEPAPAVGHESAIPLPTAEEIEAIERQAQEEGYQAGLAAGRLAAEAEVGRLRALLGGIEDVCRSAEKQLAEQVLDLALVIARQLVREQIQTDRTLLLPAIKEAIAGLSAIKEPSRLLLNPEDLTALSVLLSGDLPAESWRFIPNPAIPAGSCRIETPVSTVDLTMATRWNNLLRVLGRNNRADMLWHDEDASPDSSHAQSS